MAYSYTIIVADGSTDAFVVPFPYIAQEDVHVTLDGVAVDDLTLSWVSSSILQLASTPANGVAVKIYRQTPITNLSTVYSTPTVLDHRDWNRVLKQLQYVCQEAFDLGEISGEFVADVTTFVNTTLAAASASAAAAAASASAADGSADQAAIDAANAAAIFAAISTHMLGSNNLSELTNTTTARSNLGLGNSATKNVGTAANTVAAGDDARITDAASASSVAALDAAVVKKNATSTITVGYTVTPNNVGNTSGAFTPNPALGNYQYLNNNGAITFNAPASDCAIDYLVINTASAGAITFSGYTVAADVGDALTTTNVHRFIISVRRIAGISTYLIKALQ